MTFPTSLKAIADGAAFDTTETIRLIATYLVDTAPTFTDKAYPDLEPPIDNRGLQSKATFPEEHPLVLLIGERAAGILIAKGFATPADITNATDEDLLAIDGIGPLTLAKLRSKLARP